MASIFVDGTSIASRSSDTTKNVRRHAAEAALSIITKSKCSDTGPQAIVDYNEAMAIEGAKHKLNELCNNKRWPKPTYKVKEESGPSYQLELPDANLFAKGSERSKVKDAENSAASMMFGELQKSGYA